LRFYEISAVKQFIDAVANSDMSDINVVFVASVPNSHKDSDMLTWGHRSLARALSEAVPQEGGNSLLYRYIP
jgi:hypothetical protein